MIPMTPHVNVVVVGGPIFSDGELRSPGTHLRMPLSEAEGHGARVRYDAREALHAQRDHLFASIDAHAQAKASAIPLPRPESGRYQDRVIFLHDNAGEVGGAEASNAELMRVGRMLGFDVVHGSKDNLAETRHENAVAILCNLRGFGGEQRRFVEKLVRERGLPYVWRDHDYQFCKHRGQLPCHDGSPCSPHCTDGEWDREREAIRRLAAGAALRVFISERQREAYHRIFGWVDEPSYLLPPPVNTELFRPVPGVAREERLAVCPTGRIDPRKGRDEVTRWAAEHPNWRVEVYVRGGETGSESRGDGVPEGQNVSIRVAVPHADMPIVYSRAEVCLFLPTIPEPAGRTPVEAALCGCRPVTNENWSARAFGLSLDDPATLRREILAGIVGFWRRVQEVAWA